MAAHDQHVSMQFLCCLANEIPCITMLNYCLHLDLDIIKSIKTINQTKQNNQLQYLDLRKEYYWIDASFW
jgi:hypothetical protein